MVQYFLKSATAALLLAATAFRGAFSTPAKPMAGAMAQYREDFYSFDTNNDGVLDAQEIRTQLETKHEDNIVSFFAHYDRDDSGTIGFNEYLTFALSAANHDQERDTTDEDDSETPNGSHT